MAVPIIIANWKLHHRTPKQAVGLATKIRNKLESYEIGKTQIVIAPAIVHLSEVKNILQNNSVFLASQTVSGCDLGSHTGEIAAVQLKNLETKFVIIGHSERRFNGESDNDVKIKVSSVLSAGLIPIICIGELDRDKGGDFFTKIENQLKIALSELPPEKVKKVIIAYEPIWAIGTGKVATVEAVREMKIFIESVITRLYNRELALQMRIIYGGSVKPNNVTILWKESGMDGFLVGGASLQLSSFIKIVSAVIKNKK